MAPRPTCARATRPPAPRPALPPRGCWPTPRCRPTWPAGRKSCCCRSGSIRKRCWPGWRSWRWVTSAPCSTSTAT
nr:MAG TPA: hypothetical protein [Caudoviricetes sp.]